MSKVALYIRLSVEDQVKAGESESITNQRAYLNDYLDNIGDLKHLERVEYVDDGYSGTNENRPAFQRLLEDVKSGEIKNIVVKDMSRFMRDYIALGDYLENIFPFLGIRFISINDRYDSNESTGNGTDLDIQFKNLMYDFYSKDASAKVKSVKTALNKQGKCQAWSPPFGYMKDPDDKYKIIVDKEVDWIVKIIYELYLEGLSMRKITAYLNEHQIILPAQRKAELTNMDYSKRYPSVKEHPRWNLSSVIDILANETYTGTFLYNTIDKSIINGTKNRAKRIPKEKWGRVFNNHEAIISKEIFDKVQKLKNTKRKYKVNHKKRSYRTHSPLQGIAVCPHCNHILGCSKTIGRRKTTEDKVYYYFRCTHCKLDGLSVDGSNAEKVEPLVLQAIKERVDISDTLQNKKHEPIDYSRDIKEMEAIKQSFYEKYRLGKITRLDFIEEKKKLDSRIEELENLMEENEVVETEEVKADTLTRELLEQYIESVSLNGNKIVEIKWK